MKEVVVIKDLNIENNRFSLENISLTFYEGVNVFLCGTSGSGKTLLLKAIQKKVKYQGEINCYIKPVVLFDKSYFATSLVEDEMRYVLLNEEQKELVDNFFDRRLLKTNPNELSFYQKKLLILCSSLYLNSKIIFIDNLFSFFKQEDIKKFREYFSKCNITVVVVSTNIEEALNYDYMIVLSNGVVAIEGKTLQVLKEERLLKRLGTGIPFYVDISIQLKYYNLLDKIYVNKEDLKEKLWK